MKYAFYLLLACLVGCAYSPQQLQLQPPVEASVTAYGQGQAVMVRAEDRRESPVLGSLGGAYPQSSLVTLAPGLEQSLEQAVQAHLAAQGFNPNGQQAEAAQLLLVLDELQFQLEDSLAGKRLMLEAVLSFEVSYQGESYQGRYRTAAEHQLVIMPNKQKSEALVNDLLSQTLKRLFADKGLQAFLSNL